MASIRVQVLGAGKDIGKSCLIATMGSTTVMFDCGAHPGFGDTQRFPDFTATDLSSLSLVLITHFHLDHAAALPLLTETLGVRAPVYMTEPTRELSRLMLLDFVRTSNLRGQHCPFSAADVTASLARVRLIAIDAPLVPPELPDVEVTAYHAGHALGAAMFRVSTDVHTIVYSGDYTTRADRHLASARFAPYTRPHLFVTETTCCGARRQPALARHEREGDFLRAVASALAAGGRVLVPVPAFGRLQQLAAVLAAGWEAHALGETPVHVSEGLLLRANAVYERFPAWRADAPGAYARDVLAGAVPFNRARHWARVVTGGGPCILFVTPGNLATGLSRDVLRAWAGDARNLVVVPAFSVEAHLAGGGGARGGGLPGGGEVRCRISNLAFGVHADGDGVKGAIAALKPANVMLVHGDAGRVEAFQRELTDLLDCPVLAPKNGDVVEVQCPVYGGPDATVEALQGPEVRDYLGGQTACEAGFTGLGYASRRVADASGLSRRLEEAFGKELEKISECEYCFVQCISVTVCEKEGTIVVEWPKSTNRPMARKLLKIVDEFSATSK